MADYVVTHIWRTPDMDPYVHTVPGTVGHIDIAYAAADAIAAVTLLPTAVYLLDPDTGDMHRQTHPDHPTMNLTDIPVFLVLPAPEDGAPPIVFATNETNQKPENPA